MRIAYISPSFMSDVDLSLLKELKQKVEVDYYLQLTPFTLKGAAICLEKQNAKAGVLTIDDYPELEILSSIVPKSNFFIVNDTGTHSYSIGSYICYFKLLRKLLSGHYDIIHFTWPFAIPGFVMYFLKGKMIMTVHDPFPHSSNDDGYTRLIRKIAFKSVSNYILLNNNQKDAFAEYYNLQDKNIYLSRLGCYSYLHAYNKTKSSKQDNNSESGYILMFGNILSHKGADILLEAMEKLHVKFPKSKLIIAGRWKWKYDKYDYFKQKDYIVFLDRFIPDSELALLINNCSFCVTPYLDATQSGVIMSAFAFNKPCIATNVGGLPEMVINGKYGLIIPPKDVIALENALILLLMKPDLIEEFSMNIENDYAKMSNSWEAISHELVDIYTNMI